MELFSQLKVNNKLQGKLGLKNYGDSSFVNAIVQAISNIEPVCFSIREMPFDLPKSIGSIEDAGERTKRIDIYYALRRILRELWKDKRVIIEPAVLLRRLNAVEILKDSVSNKNIEDTFLYLLEAVHDALMQPVPALFETRVNFKPSSPIWEMISLSKDIEGDYKKALERGSRESLAYQRSIVIDSFQGIVASTVSCPCCAFKEQSLDPFFCMSLDIICHNEKAAKKKALKSDFVVSSSSLDILSKKRRKIYTEASGADKSPTRHAPRRSLTSTRSPSSFRPPAHRPSVAGAQLGRKGRVHPEDSPATEPGLAEPNANTPLPAENKSGRPEGGARITLKPISLSPTKKKKQSYKTDPKKKHALQHSDSDGNIDNRIDMELSQSSTESNQNVDAKIMPKENVSGVVPDAVEEEVNIPVKNDSYQMKKLNALGNQRQQRKHHVNLETMNAAEIAAKNKRRSSLMSSFKKSNNTSSSFPERTSAFLRTGKQLSFNLASQAKASLDIHGQKSSLHDCIQAHLADELVTNHPCPNCAEVSNITRKKRIANAPEVLVFYFRRFIKSGFFHTKDNTLINFPLENFDVTDFLDMNSEYFKGGWDQKAIYDLQVLVRHVGKDKESNHYTTMALHNPEGKWFEYHDHRVRVVSKSYVASKEALMLFYLRRKPEAMHQGMQGMQMGLQQAVRGAVLDRREALVAEVNYLLRMDRIHKVNELKNSMTQSNNRLIKSVRKSIRSSVKAIASLKRPLQRIQSGSRLGSRDEASASPTNRKTLYSLASFTEVAMTDAKIAEYKILGRGWRIVKKSLQKIVMLGRDPTLIFDNANIILEVPPTKHVFVSIYWLIKFLSFSEPGPLCNHDIACCHGGLKPHLYSCRKRICIPIPNELFHFLQSYLHQKFGYPQCLLPGEIGDKPSKDSSLLFRELRSTVPCDVCIAHHEEIMLRRREERELVVLETIRDGFEEELLPQEDAALVHKRVQQEKKRRAAEVIKKDFVNMMVKESSGSKEEKAKSCFLSKMGKGANNPKEEDAGRKEVTLSTGAPFSVADMRRGGKVTVRPADEIKFYCVIGKAWLEAWKKFCLAGKYEDIEFPHPPPGPISNFELLAPGSSSRIRPDLVLDQDYCVISPGVWGVLHDIYGGGPVLLREDVDIYSSHSGPKEVGTITC